MTVNGSLFSIWIRGSPSIKAINLLNEVNAVDKLYVYEKIGRLNGNVLSAVNVENSGGLYEDG